MQATTLQRIKIYMQSIRPFFVNWNIRLVAENWIIKVYYKSAFIDFNVKDQIPTEDKQAFTTVVCFCFNAYSDYEWGGETLTSTELWTLLATSPENVRQMIKKIYTKLRVYGEQFLQEEQETRVVHHRKQKPARSVIQKEQSSRDSGKKKKRIEKPLW